MEDTPLGHIIAIRSEKNKDIIKNFTASQRRIQSEWRSWQAGQAAQNMSREDYNRAMADFERAFASLSGSPGSR